MTPALAELLANHSTSIHQFVSAVEHNLREEVAQSEADANEARNERDDTLRALEELRLKHKEEIAKLKASLQAARSNIALHEQTITHQQDAMAQLKREAKQWKDQSESWQGHFLRVENERCAMSSRLDEVITGRQVNPPGTDDGPLTPVSGYAEDDEAAPSDSSDLNLLPPRRRKSHGSTTTPSYSGANRKQPIASGSKFVPYHPPTGAKSKSAKRSNATPRPTEPILIRRVSTSVYVKQEKDSEAEEEHEQVALSAYSRVRKRVPDDYDPDLIDDGEDDELMMSAPESSSKSITVPVGSKTSSPHKRRKTVTAKSRRKA